MPPSDSPDALLAVLPYAALRLRRLGDPLAWRARARPEQLPAEGTPHLYLRGGRGSGKTWAGAHGLAEVILTGSGAVNFALSALLRDALLRGETIRSTAGDFAVRL